MEDTIKLEARDFVISGIEKFSGGGSVNFEVSYLEMLTVKACLQICEGSNG